MEIFSVAQGFWKDISDMINCCDILKSSNSTAINAINKEILVDLESKDPVKWIELTYLPRYYNIVCKSECPTSDWLENNDVFLFSIFC